MGNKKFYYDLTADEKIKNEKHVLTIGEVLYHAMENARIALINSKNTINNLKVSLNDLPKDGVHSEQRHILNLKLKDFYELCEFNKQKYKAYRKLYNKWIKFTQKNPLNDNRVLMSLNGFEEIEGTPKERYSERSDTKNN